MKCRFAPLLLALWNSIPLAHAAASAAATATATESPSPAPAVPAPGPESAPPESTASTTSNEPASAETAAAGSVSVTDEGPTPKAPEAAKPATPPGPPPPLNPLLRVSLAVDTVWNTDPGYDLISENDVDPRVGLRAELQLLSAGSASLGVELGFSGEESDDEPAHSPASATLEATHAFLGLVPRYQVLPFLGVHAHAFGGASFNALEVNVAGRHVDHESIDPFVALGAGLSLQTELWRTHASRSHWNSLGFGAQVEGGYWLGPAIDVDVPTVAADPPAQRLPVSGAALGSLDRSGPYVTVSGFVRF